MFVNRAERRRQAREAEKSNALITMTAGQIEIIKQQAYDDAIHDVMHIALGVSAFVLHDKYGQLMRKENREIKFIDFCLDAWSAIESGHLSLQDTVKALKDEAGCDIIEIGLNWRRQNVRTQK